MNLSYNKLSFWSLMLGLLSVMSIPSVSLGATKGVTAGCAGAQCGGFGVGFVDDTSGTGGLSVPAITDIAVGDTVHWHFDAGVNTV
jgi:hypothetical protein